MNDPMKDPLKDYVREKDKNIFMRLAGVIRGNLTTEYAILIAFMALIVTAFITWLGFQMFDLFSGINENLPAIETEPNTVKDVTNEAEK